MAGTARRQRAWQLHAHIWPPAPRSVPIPMFMMGFALRAKKRREITAESAAAGPRDSIVAREAGRKTRIERSEKDHVIDQVAAVVFD